jgi:Spy/CpxP family protein refolding chaperone
MNKKAVFGIFAAAFALATLSACKTPSAEEKANWAVKIITKKLDLTDEQQVKLSAVKDAFLEAKKRNADATRESKEEIKQIILAEKLESSRVQSLMKKRQAIVDAEFNGVFVKVADFHASLTAEQRKDAVYLLEKFDARHSR